MANKNLRGGLFITFEGPEGSGKSTQSKLLYRYLNKQGYDVILMHEPGKTSVGRKIRSILLDPKNRKINPVAEMLLYMASRAQLVEDKIKPTLEKKRIIICDRFLDSTLVYQGYGLGMDLRFINSVGNIVCQGIKPSLTILLDIPPIIGLRRSNKIKDRIERRNISYHNRVRKGYLAIAKDNPRRVRLILAQDSKLNTHLNIKKIVDDLIGRYTNT